MIYNIKNNRITSWINPNKIREREFTCAYCGNSTSSVLGLGLDVISPHSEGQGIYICSHCQMPTFIWAELQSPGNKYGNDVAGITDNLKQLYNEARSCYSVGAYTGVVLLCRKLLMNISIELGAKSGIKFIEYVNYLEKENYITARSKSWVDKIRTVGNEATHRAEVKTKEDAANLINFCEMIMKTNFEYPNRVE